MTITNLALVTLGKMVELGPGDILEIQVSFDYITSQPADAVLWASLGIGIGRDIESFKDIHLEATAATKTWSGVTEIQIPTSDKNNGTYWMKVEINGEEVTIQGAVVISGMPTTGFGQIGQLITLMIVMMMMNMMMSVIGSPEATMYAAGEKVSKVTRKVKEIKEIPAATKRAFRGEGES